MPVPSAEPRRGGPRKRDLVLRTVVDELAVTPYAQLTVERIAEASGVHKTTLYRWWSGKPELVADALATLMDTGPVPDTGSTRDDLVQWLAGTVRNYAGSPLGVAMPALISDLARTPEGLAAFRGAFLADRRTNCVEVIDRGWRGEICRPISTSTCSWTRSRAPSSTAKWSAVAWSTPTSPSAWSTCSYRRRVAPASSADVTRTAAAQMNAARNPSPSIGATTSGPRIWPRP